MEYVVGIGLSGQRSRVFGNSAASAPRRHNACFAMRPSRQGSSTPARSNPGRADR
jgi:hypothetical protein